MSIVPREVAERFEKDYYESKGIGFDLIVEGIAQWALEQAIAECEAVHSQLSDEYDINGTAAASWCAASIRAMISPEGKLKGGESDGQE
jgi:hypothetical protein